MKKINAGRLIWAVLSAAIAFGLNHFARPHVEASFERGGARETQFGTLTLADPALAIPTGAVHVVAEDVEHFGKTYALREISLRSQAARGGAPSFELFIALPADASASPGHAVDPKSIVQLELPVQQTGRLGGRESFVQREGEHIARVLTGTWQFTDVRENWESGQGQLEADARVELQVETAKGVDMLTGRWTGRLLLQ